MNVLKISSNNSNRESRLCAGIFFWPGILFTSLLGAEPAARVTERFPFGQLLEIIAGLLLVLAVFFCFSILLRRFSRGQGGGRGNIQVIDALHLGSREKLILVRVAESYLLLGMTPGRISALHVLREEIETMSPDSQAGFVTHLNRMLHPDRNPQ